MSDTQSVAPNKDLDNEYPIATVWRPTLVRIVHAMSERDYGLKQTGLVDVSFRQGVPELMQDCVSAYGETLIPLPEAAWDTSISRWMGTYWQLLVDLWTSESGRSDLVLHVRVTEGDGSYKFQVDSAHVP